MKFIHTIVSVNRPDLLEIALESTRPLWNFTSILDNSPGGCTGTIRNWPVPVIRPSVPLSCAQSMNFLARLAKEQDATFFGYQHEDAQVGPGTPENFLATLNDLVETHPNCCALLTRYDILSAYQLAAVEDIGDWDTGFPNPNYHIDIDWFYRARLKGYTLLDTGFQVTHLEGGSVTRREPLRDQIHNVTCPMNETYYVAKWGGPPHHETFEAAWNKPALSQFHPPFRLAFQSLNVEQITNNKFSILNSQ